jgi:hypothetical protein
VEPGLHRTRSAAGLPLVAIQEGERVSKLDLERHDCRESGEGSWWEHDGRGFPLCRVCRICEKAKMARYRPEILRPYTQADVDEPIEEDD